MQQVLVVMSLAAFFTLLHSFLSPSVQSPSTMAAVVNGVTGLIAGAFVIHTILVFLGAKVFDDFTDTAFCAFSLSAVSAAPLAAMCQHDWNSFSVFRSLSDIIILGNAKSEMERGCVAAAVGALTGAWLGSMFLPLDWGVAWIQWPLPPIYFGCAGHALGIVSFSFQRWVTKKVRKYHTR